MLVLLCVIVQAAPPMLFSAEPSMKITRCCWEAGCGATGMSTMWTRGIEESKLAGSGLSGQPEMIEEPGMTAEGFSGSSGFNFL